MDIKITTLTTERQPIPSIGIEYQGRKKEERVKFRAEKYQHLITPNISNRINSKSILTLLFNGYKLVSKYSLSRIRSMKHDFFLILTSLSVTVKCCSTVSQYYCRKV